MLRWQGRGRVAETLFTGGQSVAWVDGANLRASISWSLKADNTAHLSVRGMSAQSESQASAYSIPSLVQDLEVVIPLVSWPRALWEAEGG